MTGPQPREVSHLLSCEKIGRASWRYYTDSVACRPTEYYLRARALPIAIRVPALLMRLAPQRGDPVYSRTRSNRRRADPERCNASPQPNSSVQAQQQTAEIIGRE